MDTNKLICRVKQLKATLALNELKKTIKTFYEGLDSGVMKRRGYLLHPHLYGG